ncbi:synaptotagmin-1-like [Tachypleus tridentatus]|uniref:synaptotagmin-1-like n=1 Tax=Tachypleus tridentatus TaxID=6853 RepID=UPI003FD278C6
MSVSPMLLGITIGVGLTVLMGFIFALYRCHKSSQAPESSNQLADPSLCSEGNESRSKVLVLTKQGVINSLHPQQNFNIFREQPKQADSHAPIFGVVASTVTSTHSSGSASSVSSAVSTSTVKTHVNELQVRLSLPDVHVPDEKVTLSQSSYSLPMMMRRPPIVNKVRSVDIRHFPPASVKSLSSRSDNQQSTTTSDPRSPATSHHRTPSPDTSTLFPVPDLTLHPTPAGSRPRSPASPLLSPSYLPTSDFSASPGTVSPIGVIQPDLYTKKDMVFFHSSDNEEATKHGRLHFRLKYDFNRSDLVVHVIEAQDLGTVSENGFNDPYVKVTLLPEVDSKQRQTNICRNSIDPVFDEIFKIPVSFEELPEKVLLLQIFDYDRFSRNGITGEVKVQMCNFDVTTDVEVWSDITKMEQVSKNRPELLLSLNYLPSAGRLTVVILKASNLMPSEYKVHDSYVKVCLTYRDKRMKKKKTTKKGSKNPVWNEALSFDVSEEDLKHCNLVVNVVKCHHGNSLHLGACSLGENESDKGTSHWEVMLQNPRKSIAMWHDLY